MTPDEQTSPVGRGNFDKFEGPFDQLHHRRFERIDRELMKEIAGLKEAIAEFDSYRHAWAEMSANDTKPGRGSELAKRMEVMQGHALMMLDSAAWRLRTRINGYDPNEHAGNRLVGAAEVGRRRAQHIQVLPDSRVLLDPTPTELALLELLNAEIRRLSPGAGGETVTSAV